MLPDVAESAAHLRSVSWELSQLRPDAEQASQWPPTSLITPEPFSAANELNAR